jgi:hypothetical protein
MTPAPQGLPADIHAMRRLVEQLEANTEAMGQALLEALESDPEILQRAALTLRYGRTVGAWLYGAIIIAETAPSEAPAETIADAQQRCIDILQRLARATS